MSATVAVMAAIAGNSVVLALHDYKDTNNSTLHNQRLAVGSDIFTWLFCVEAVINIIALGPLIVEQENEEEIRIHTP